ncbi:serine hydroxymethyltransferase [Haploplasma modicum]|uniref:serine hydroxymethyltransferase n=1 Tax=Haploplasma modicum TaxID=2150 RepID=UPI00214C1A68|nr:serine hydroxymethyltransferase [Haploplasma modicum]MCR1808674.1 serine hydroxymethyltransferase [Haploplasma modicum]
MKNNNIRKILFGALENEANRQRNHLELIASENFVSDDVLTMQGSILTNKYAEGYPGKRYYGGCEFVDVLENEAIESLKKLFGANFANVQPHSGSQANMAAYAALLEPGDLILGMSLNEGGHLTHGYKLSFSGNFYKSAFYGVNKETEMIDYEEVRKIANKVKPKIIVAGASAYSRTIDFKKFREIADEVGAYLMVDMAHIAGLVATNLHPSPIPYAHVVTSTTHKTLRGPRGGIILTNDEAIAKKVNSAVFPGAQGGPLMHVIGAKAVAFNEALEDSFKTYQMQVIKNAKTMAEEFSKLGYRIVSGTTDNHLVLIDVYSKLNLTGKQAEDILGSVNITINKNTIPFDTLKPNYASGIRVGSPAVTTRGLKEEEMKLVVRLIDRALLNYQDENILNEIKNEVIQLMSNYPLFNE